MKFRIKILSNRHYPQVKLHWFSCWRTISKSSLFHSSFILFDEDYEDLCYTYDEALDVIKQYKVERGLSMKESKQYVNIK